MARSAAQRWASGGGARTSAKIGSGIASAVASIARKSFFLLHNLALSAALWAASANGREVRVATFNVLDGIEATNSVAYQATKSVLSRINADIVSFQELTSATYGQWTNMAAELGYPYTAFGTLGAFAGGLYVGFFSRFPIASTHSVTSPPGAVEITRAPLCAVFDVPDAARPLVFWTMHHKASTGDIDKFRRSIEAYRIAQDINAYLSNHPDQVEYVFGGDMNADVLISQTPSQFNSQPAGAPVSYALGSDIAFPVPYAIFPNDRYAGAGNGLTPVAAFIEGTSDAITHHPTARRLDYIFLSPALLQNGMPPAEVYYSPFDQGGGLPKAGAALPSGASANASDHLPVFVDLQMADSSAVAPASRLVSEGEFGGPFAPDYFIYTVANTGAVASIWSITTDVTWIAFFMDDPVVQPNASTEVEVWLDANTLPPGQHVGHLIFSNETTGVVESRELAVTVRDYLNISPASGLAASGVVGGPFTPTGATYVVSNKQPFAVDFTATAPANWITVTPSSWRLQGGQSVAVNVGLNANANALPAGNYATMLTISNQTSGRVETRQLSLSPVEALCEAVDACDFVWTTGGDSSWFLQTNTTFDGVDAAESGPLTANKQTWIETTITGPAQISFRWRASSRSTHYLYFRRDGSLMDWTSGQTGWSQEVFEISSGQHTLRWTFTNTSAAAQYSNAVWLDQFRVNYLMAAPSYNWSVSAPPGGPFYWTAQLYSVTNTSLDSVTWNVTSTTNWLLVAPDSGVLSGRSGAQILAQIDTNLAAALPPGTHSAFLVFSNETSGIAFTRTVSISISDYLVASPSYFDITGIAGGPHSPTSFVLGVSNSGPINIGWTAKTNVNWLKLNPVSGTLAPGATGAVLVSITTNANSLRPGYSYGNIFVSNTTTRMVQSFSVALNAEDPLRISPPGWNFSGPVGGPFTPPATTFALTNQSGSPVTWRVSTTSSWLSLSATTGTLAGNMSANVAATLNGNSGALPAGVYLARVLFSNRTMNAVSTQTVMLAIGTSLCDALDACRLSWSVGGNFGWYGQTNTTKDGVDAASSGPISDNQESWMQTDVVGPGALSFWWKVSSEASWDFLEIWIDGALTNRISGAVDWQQNTFALTGGTHTIRWRYIKDVVFSGGEDRGWVDLVSWIPTYTARGVPTAWYQRFGMEPGQEEWWDDLDLLPSASGEPNWVQYVNGLTPTNPADQFHIVNLSDIEGSPAELRWWGGTNGPSSPYIVQGCVELGDGAWQSLGANERAPGWNVWTNLNPAATNQFYRILALPNP